MERLVQVVLQSSKYIACMFPFFSWIHMFLIVLFCDIMEGAVIPASSSISGLNFWQKCAFQIQFGDSFMSGMWWYREWYANTSQGKGLDATRKISEQRLKRVNWEKWDECWKRKKVKWMRGRRLERNGEIWGFEVISGWVKVRLGRWNANLRLVRGRGGKRRERKEGGAEKRKMDAENRVILNCGGIR